MVLSLTCRMSPALPIYSKIAVAATLQRCTLATSAPLDRWKSLWRKNRRPADSRFRPDREENYVKQRKAFGGRKKLKALQMVSGNYELKSVGVSEELRILQVVHSDAGSKFRDRNIIAKSTYLLVDGNPLIEKISESSQQNVNLISMPDNNQIALPSLAENINEGRLYAKVTSRPGQVGNVDGYIVEGQELALLMEKLKVYEADKSS